MRNRPHPSRAFPALAASAALLCVLALLGNLYFAYLDSSASSVVVLLSTDSGATFTTLATFPGSVDQPMVVATDNTVDPSPAVWVVWNQAGQMVARGASVAGLGSVGAFGPLQTIPGTVGCSFGDVAISPAGAVVQVCQTPTGGQGPANILVNTDPDGVGGSNFGAVVIATSTNVGGFDFIPPQNTRSVDAEAGLAYDQFDGSAASSCPRSRPTRCRATWRCAGTTPATPAPTTTWRSSARWRPRPAPRRRSSPTGRSVPLHDRYVALYEDFADAWRVDDATSLFDYAGGTSTATFTLLGWPKEDPPCELPKEPVADPLDPAIAQAACAPIKNQDRRQDCVYDVTVAGELGFVDTYLWTEEVETGVLPGNCTVDVDLESGAAGWFNDPASTCSSGDWVLGRPEAVTNGGVTTQVGGANSGVNAVFTGVNSSAGADDVDGGNCILSSPAYSVSSASRLSLAYFHGQRDAGDDPGGDFFSLEVSTDGGASFTPLASNGDATSTASWTTVSTPIPPGSKVVLRVQCSDGAGSGDLVECGIDDISICVDGTANVTETED